MDVCRSSTSSVGLLRHGYLIAVYSVVTSYHIMYPRIMQMGVYVRCVASVRLRRRGKLGQSALRTVSLRQIFRGTVNAQR